MKTHYRFTELTAITDSGADTDQSGLFKDSKTALGFVPNMYRTMANSPALLRTYMKGYDEFRTHSGLSSAEQEVVFLALSKDNGCDYCLAAHSTLAASVSGVAADVLSAILADKTISDAKLQALYEMTIELNQSRGRPDAAVVNSFFDAGYQEITLLSLLLAVSVKVISNYSNHLFDTPLDDAFAQYRVK